MASNGRRSESESMADQLSRLQTAVEDAGKETGEKAAAIAEKGRQILSLARELAGELAEATRETVSDKAGRAYRAVRDTAQYDVEVARETVREHPLLAIAGVAAISALVAAAVTGAVARRRY